VSVYLDATAIVSAFVRDGFSDRARTFLGQEPTGVLVSDFAAAELASVVSRYVRTNAMTREAALLVFPRFDDWRATSCEEMWLEMADVAVATALLRRLDSPLRAPDALHLAMAQRAAASLLTFDDRLAAAAARLGIELAAA